MPCHFLQENGTKNLEGVKKLNLPAKIELNMFLIKHDQTVPCTLNSFIGIGGLGGKGRRKNERTDRVHVEVDIECDKQKLEGQTSICSGAIHCSRYGLVASTMLGITMSKSELRP